MNRVLQLINILGLAVLALIQSYSQFINYRIAPILAIALLFSCLFLIFHGRKNLKLSLPRDLFWFSSVSAMFAAFYGLMYQGSQWLLYVEPFLILPLAATLMWNSDREFLATNTVYVGIGIVLAASLVTHGVLASAGLSDRPVLIGEANSRYGFIDGRNHINVTGANLALQCLALQILILTIRGYRLIRIILFIGVIGGSIAIMATGSRSALLMMLGGSFVTFAGYAKGFGMVRSFALAAIAGVLVVILYSNVAYLPQLFQMAFDRIATVINVGLWDSDLSISYRTGIMVEAFNQQSGIIFGSGLEASRLIGSSPDNFFTAAIYSYGLIGFLALTCLGVILLGNCTLGGWGVLTLALPMFIRSMAEGMFLERSTIFSFVLLAVIIKEMLVTQNRPARGYISGKYKYLMRRGITGQ